MKKLTLLLSATALAAVLVVPAGASAAPRASGSDCTYTADEANATGAGGLVVYGGTDTNPATNEDGVSGEADLVVGACLDATGGAGAFDGGTLEAGVGNPTVVGPGAGGPAGVYVIADGDNDNTAPSNPNAVDPTGASDGYIGVSNFETDPAAGDQCEVPDDDTGGGGTNSGGCLTIRDTVVPLGPIAAVPGVPLLVCGDDSSAPNGTWEDSGRDGCTLPS